MTDVPDAPDAPEHAQQLDVFLSSFAEVADGEQLASLWQQIPPELEQPFLDALDALIVHAEQATDAEVADGLRQRRDSLRQMIDASAQLMERIAADVAGLEAAEDNQAVAAIWNEMPIDLEEAFLAAAEQRAADLGEEPAASRLHAQVATLRQARQQHEELANQPPVVRALLAFLQIPEDDRARQIFTEHKALLQPYEAQRMADQVVESAPDEQRAHFAARSALLRELRGAAPAPLSNQGHERSLTVQNTTVEGDLIQVAGDYIDQTAINLLRPREWIPPEPPEFPEDAIDRPQRVAEVAALLSEADTVAIGGRSTVALQGIAGIGKTTLAQLLARQLFDQGRYPDGVLWEDIGPTVTAPEQVQVILDKWGALAAIGPEGTSKRLSFAPDLVRTLLSQHRRLLVLLDNVWSLDAIRPLRDALPRGVDLIITTRIPRIMRAVGGRVYQLDQLSDTEVLDLIAARLEWRPATLADTPWLEQLVEGVERHTLALDVALHLLRDVGATPASWQKTAKSILNTLTEARDFAGLEILESDGNQNIEKVLAYSYTHGPLARIEGLQARFRCLGAVAPSASFGLAAIMSLWECDEVTAMRALNDLSGAGLLERTEHPSGVMRWRQDLILRSYALALLHRAGEYDQASATYARAYLQLMAQADKVGDYGRMLPEVPHLRHAATWAIENDLDLALNLISVSADMQAAFNLIADGLKWSQEVLKVAQARGSAAELARAHGSLGNALQRAAPLAGEDRGAHLREALAAYEAALRFYTPEAAPLDYAMTQNNRAVLFSELASVPGEDRGAHLREALAAYEAALRFYTPETAPLDYAMTQNNRAVLLRELVSMPGEDRGAHLREALAAYESALRFYTPETAPLDYAMTQNNRAVLLRELASMPGEDRGARLREALAAYESALRFRTPETAPLDYAMTQNNRAVLLVDLASVPGEDRRSCLREALAAYESALRFYTPETAPLDYAMTQNNRANCLSEIATLPGEDRGLRLREALAAYDQALRFRTPESVPLAYASTQNNRANLLGELASSSGEDHGARLREALAAYDQALRFYTPESAPLAYASTQNNRANRLSELSRIPGEDRGAHLRDALAAYNQALHFRTPETVPLDYAATQSNLFNLYSALANLPGENRRNNLYRALQCGIRALKIFRHIGHQQYQQQVMRQIQGMRFKLGDEFNILWAELAAGPLPDWLADQPDQPGPTMPPDLQARLATAGVTDDASLQGVLQADPELARAYGDFIAAHPGLQIQSLIGALLQLGDAQALLAFWQQLPAELEDPLLTAVATLLAQAQQAGDENLVAALGQRLEGLRQIRDAQRGRAADPRQQAFDAALRPYLAQAHAAQASERDVASWQAAAAAGEALLDPALAETPNVNWEALQANLAATYTSLSIALEEASDLDASLAATERAIALQPDEAMWRRNRVGTLIDLGRLDEAAAELERARAMHPNAPRLDDLAAALEQVRNSNIASPEGDND